ncbi:uncharacterized protein BCR38DRAFT_497893 [Pseudomassariella vexata]|uniref:Short chain dehydrogenase n=1 Tax=Pseudomassariella vexata TaxID=1141098 RepID=A0A1Y2DLQ6_9PEZI|nr:uncharacterized protein BCR38DRAFT_497893 [Pseudomassariella vexata]ORY60238.1 hypothetical protein BCR38DRAFT_497893 [Pseudomassariella vexata]
MSTYLITGVSRGLGFEFLRQLSEDPANTVVGLVRDKATTEKKASVELHDRDNIHLLQGDITDYAFLKKAVDATAAITGGALDYVIANAAFISTWSAFDPIGVLGNQPEKLEQDLLGSLNANVIGNIHLFNLTIPLVLRGHAKKIIAISSGMADIDVITKFDITESAPYSISKAALNAAVAKFSAQYAKDGVLFLSISPGLVDTGNFKDATIEQQQALFALMGKFKKFAPHFTGPTTPDLAIRDVLSVIKKASVDADKGAFISQHGDKNWL